jgi:hypothetical protein
VDPVVEDLSAKLHTLYQLEAKRQGDVRHHDDYAQLAENTKEFHRVLARFILKYASPDMVRDMLRDPLTEGAPQ